MQDPGIKDALFQEECRQDPDFLKQVLALERMLQVKTRTESASLSALSVPVVSPARSLGVSLARSAGENSLEDHVFVFSGNVAFDNFGVQRVHSRRTDTAHAIAGESVDIIELLEVCETDFSKKVGATVAAATAGERKEITGPSFLRRRVPLLWQRPQALRQLIRPGYCMLFLLCF